MSDAPREPIISWQPSRPNEPADAPPKRSLWSRLFVAVLAIALVAWSVLGALLLFAMMIVLGLESGNHPEHSADFARTGAIWLIGIVVGAVGIVLLRRRGKRPHLDS